MYFSGHGVRRETGKKPETAEGILLVLYDYDSKGAGEVTHRKLLDALAPAKAERKIVILDF